MNELRAHSPPHYLLALVCAAAPPCPSSTIRLLHVGLEHERAQSSFAQPHHLLIAPLPYLVVVRRSCQQRIRHPNSSCNFLTHTLSTQVDSLRRSAVRCNLAQSSMKRWNVGDNRTNKAQNDDVKQEELFQSTIPPPFLLMRKLLSRPSHQHPPIHLLIQLRTQSLT
ncbi:hypothetical protein BDZ97DRAFT_554754 [Flammula alnicola]|nr:hypothetical protein BDZ97DRAFT_554754 [Flammula alnicola]